MTDEQMAALKEMLSDPQAAAIIREAVTPKEEVQDEVPEWAQSKRNPKIWSGNITAKEEELAKKLQPKEARERSARDPVKRVRKTCSCGRVVNIFAGSVLDRTPFICDNCLSGSR